MKHVALPSLFRAVALITTAGLLRLGEASAAESPRLTPRPPRITIGPPLEKPQDARKLLKAELGSYLMVHFKDHTRSAFVAIHRDGYTFAEVNEGQRQAEFTGAVHQTPPADLLHRLDSPQGLQSHFGLEATALPIAFGFRRSALSHLEHNLDSSASPLVLIPSFSAGHRALNAAW